MLESPAKVLAVDDKQDMLDTVRKVMTRKGFEVVTALSGAEGLDAAAREIPDVVLVDLKMSGMDGIAFLRELRRRGSAVPVVLMTAFATAQTALAAVKEGAFDYITKPFGNDQLELVLSRAIEHRRLADENRLLLERVSEKEAFSSIIGGSSSMRRVLVQIQKVAANVANVLILGESGTGKELIARALHQASQRKRPFVPVDCAALPEHLLESELFGYEKGAFTGANGVKVGLLEFASGGTLFLDEVTELAAPLQAKLLRVLQERTIRRLGGTDLREVDIRILSATNSDIDACVREGRFRSDLCYRLRVVTIEVPPLREREGDIALLAQYFFDEFNAKTPKTLEGISSAAMIMLESYNWPGNVRELRNVIERAIALSDSTHITPLDLPPALLAAVETADETALGAGEFQRDKQALITRFERDYVARVLSDTDGNVAEAARRAGMERAAFHRLMRKYGVGAAPYRKG